MSMTTDNPCKDLPASLDLVGRLKLGQVVSDANGETWIFIGWATTTNGKTASFVRSMEGRRLITGVWHYSASFRGTLYKKFPSLAPDFWNK